MGKKSRRQRAGGGTGKAAAAAPSPPNLSEMSEAERRDLEIAESHTLHKKEFDRIRTKYKLDNPAQAERIADMLAKNAGAGAGEGVSAPAFAEMFGMSTTEAVVFLEWIQVGVKFKEETLDNAKKAGLGG